jgi:hypothetical protein
VVLVLGSDALVYWCYITDNGCIWCLFDQYLVMCMLCAGFGCFIVSYSSIVDETAIALGYALLGRTSMISR